MALDLLVSPLISFVVEKARNSLIEQFCQMHGMEKNREKLQRQLLAIQAVIANAESRTKESHVQAWLKELNAAAYKAVDVLDEFQYEALRQEAMSQRPASCIEKVTKLFNSDKNPILFRCKMSNKLKNVLENINEIITEMNAFGFTSTPNDPPSDIIRTPTHSFVDESEVIGRDGAKREITNMILDSKREKEKVSVLPIVGMGGAGKTTLAQLVYNEEQVKDHFELRMWVCVSNDFEVGYILKSMIEVVESGKCEITNMEVLQNHVRKILERKKYLLVLDDVWDDGINKWDGLKMLLFSGASLGSVIIVTTRSTRVAFIMRTLPPHDLAMLNEEDSWKLFQKRAFGESEETQQFVEIGRKIVHKCAGLPLALKALGALMRHKRTVGEWHAIYESKVWDDEASTTEILPALKLSYDHLPGYMKQCFVFCAIFPQDYVIEKETLVQLWMANDFIPTNEKNDLEGEGRNIFEVLCSRSFFQEIREMGDGRWIPKNNYLQDA